MVKVNPPWGTATFVFLKWCKRFTAVSRFRLKWTCYRLLYSYLQNLTLHAMCYYCVSYWPLQSKTCDIDNWFNANKTSRDAPKPYVECIVYTLSIYTLKKDR